MPSISHHNGQRTRKQSVVRVYANAPQRNTYLLGYYGSDVSNNADIIMAYYAQCYRILRALRLASPSCLDNPISEALSQVAGVRTVATMNLNASSHSDKTENIITINRIATTRQLKIYAFQILVND